MRHLLDSIVVFICATVRLRVLNPRARNEFFAAQRLAQETWERLGAQNGDTQWAVFRALDAWQTWQRRSVESLKSVGPNPTADEWHAISLLKSMDSEFAPTSVS